MSDTFRMLSNKLIWHPEALARWQKGEAFSPIHLDIGATSRCNYRCVHCLYEYLEHKPRDLSREVLLSLMHDIGRAGVRSIFFASQGEPLMNPATPEAVVTAARTGVDVALSSNGSLFGAEIAEEILPHLKWVRISMLAFSEAIYCRLHGTSSKNRRAAIENIAYLAEFKKKNKLSTTLGVQTCLLPEGGPDIVPLVSFLKEVGFDYITLRPISHHPRNSYHVDRDLLADFREQLQEAEGLAGKGFEVVVRWNLMEEVKPYDQCLGLPFIAFVNADGGIYTCGCHLDESAYCYGNLNEKGFQEIWFSDARRELTAQAGRRPDFTQCDLFCRHHAINKFLWDYAREPSHVNFI